MITVEVNLFYLLYALCPVHLFFFIRPSPHSKLKYIHTLKHAMGGRRSSYTCACPTPLPSLISVPPRPVPVKAWPIAPHSPCLSTHTPTSRLTAMPPQLGPSAALGAEEGW
jgi:hypothetical protein